MLVGLICKYAHLTLYMVKYMKSTKLPRKHLILQQNCLKAICIINYKSYSIYPGCWHLPKGPQFLHDQYHWSGPPGPTDTGPIVGVLLTTPLEPSSFALSTKLVLSCFRYPLSDLLTHGMCHAQGYSIFKCTRERGRTIVSDPPWSRIF